MARDRQSDGTDKSIGSRHGGRHGGHGRRYLAANQFLLQLRIVLMLAIGKAPP